MPMAHEFNEEVAMDLKIWEGYWILHMIDMWSRYTVSVFTNQKQPANVIDAIMMHWIGRYGIMGSVLIERVGNSIQTS